MQPQLIRASTGSNLVKTGPGPSIRNLNTTTERNLLSVSMVSIEDSCKLKNKLYPLILKIKCLNHKIF